MNIHDVFYPFQKYFRSKRMTQFVSLFGLVSKMQVLDVGGNPFNWTLVTRQPDLTIVNICAPPEDPGVAWLIGDGCSLPFGNNAFDIVYSNSVIEHLGNGPRQQKFAKEIRRVGRRYYVQTPNRKFFLEPHLITPFIHFVPKSRRARLLRNFTIWGWLTRPSLQECNEFVEEVCLLDEREMRRLFPDAVIFRESFLGFTKSLIAVKNRRVTKK